MMNKTRTSRGIAGRIAIAGVAVLLSLSTSAESPGEAGQSPSADLEVASTRIGTTELRATTSTDLLADEGLDYLIGKQDLLEIRVFDLEELSQTVRVSGDGFISLPLLGRVRVAGLTKTQLEARIAELLEGKYLLDPQVTVFVKEYESKKVTISGAVAAPGRYEMIGPMTLLDMLSLAGGLQEGHGREIVVFRSTPDGTTERLPVDLQRLVFDADPATNLRLEPGDVVYVTALERVRIFVGGAVNSPNMYEIPKTEPITVLKAITLAGGTTPRAAEKNVQIIRTDDSGQRTTLTVNYRKVKRGKAEDPTLQAEDVVFVQQSFF
jgi:polysaccharide export outer membrane protein